MSDLSDLLDEIKAERPARSEPNEAFDDPICGKALWSPQDKLPSISMELSKYEAHWLYWRLQVHLRSYEAMEWSEMKEVLECLTKRISSILTAKTSPTADASILVEESSDQRGQPMEASCSPSPVAPAPASSDLTPTETT